MLKVALGVDFGGHYGSAVRLLRRVDFKDVHVLAFHAIESVPEFARLGSASPYRGAFECTEVEAESLLAKAVKQLEPVDAKAEAVIDYGAGAIKLMQLAASKKVDLIAVGSERKGRWGSLFFGSVSRGLCIDAKQSFLIGKDRAEGSGPLNAVFATDHSEYCDRCAERFLAMAPRGLKSLTLLTADWTDVSMLEVALRESSLNADELEKWIQGKLRRKGEALAKRVESLGIKCDIKIVRDDPREAISATMRDTNADLLIMGARGHGLLDRLTLGSVAMQQVVVEPYPVLVIRS